MFSEESVRRDCDLVDGSTIYAMIYSIGMQVLPPTRSQSLITDTSGIRLSPKVRHHGNLPNQADLQGLNLFRIMVCPLNAAEKKLNLNQLWPFLFQSM